jgi:hypothetical protein
MYVCAKCKASFNDRRDVTIGGRSWDKKSYVFYCRPCRRVIWLRYIQSPKGRAYLKRASARYHAKKGQKYAARVAVGNAVYMGRLRKPKYCEMGGVKCVGVLQGHHADYSKKLEVRWLCARHHSQVHHPKLVV